MTDLVALAAANARRFALARPTRDANAAARRLIAAKQRYLTVQLKTGVPWFVIAVIHEREASQRWDTQLGQGDPLNRTSIHVPAGRGPFASWEAGAVDALAACAPYAARWTDWSAGGALTLLEQYNGLGYAAGPVERRPDGERIHHAPQPSPYVWAGTDQYVAGKYVADGDFDPDVVDRQLGCAALLTAMMTLDPTITFTGATLTPAAPARPQPAPAAKPPPSAPIAPAAAPGGWLAALVAVLRALVKRS